MFLIEAQWYFRFMDPSVGILFRPLCNALSVNDVKVRIVHQILIYENIVRIQINKCKFLCHAFEAAFVSIWHYSETDAEMCRLRVQQQKNHLRLCIKIAFWWKDLFSKNESVVNRICSFFKDLWGSVNRVTNYKCEKLNTTTQWLTQYAWPTTVAQN